MSAPTMNSQEPLTVCSFPLLTTRIFTIETWPTNPLPFTPQNLPSPTQSSYFQSCCLTDIVALRSSQLSRLRRCRTISMAGCLSDHVEGNNTVCSKCGRCSSNIGFPYEDLLDPLNRHASFRHPRLVPPRSDALHLVAL